MQIGLCSIADGESAIEDVIDTAASVGCRAIEIWGRDHVGDGSPATCRDIRDAATARSLNIAVYGSYLRPGTPEYETEVESALQTADRLGASMIRVWAGTQEYQDRTDEHWDQVVADLIDLTDRAAAYNLEVTIEKHEGTLTNDGDGARRLIEAVDRDTCRLNWQPLFGLPADEILAEAHDLAPLSNNVHVQAVPEAGLTWEHRCLLEDAHFDLPAVLEAFDAAGFDGCIEIEFVTDEMEFETALRRDVAYLESLLN